MIGRIRHASLRAPRRRPAARPARRSRGPRRPLLLRRNHRRPAVAVARLPPRPAAAAQHRRQADRQGPRQRRAPQVRGGAEKARQGREGTQSSPPTSWPIRGRCWCASAKTGQAVEVLRAAQRDHPNHFKIVANLGTAYQLGRRAGPGGRYAARGGAPVAGQVPGGGEGAAAPGPTAAEAAEGQPGPRRPVRRALRRRGGQVRAGPVGGRRAQEAAGRRGRGGAATGAVAAGRRQAALATRRAGGGPRRRADGGGDHGRLRHRVRPALAGPAGPPPGQPRCGRRVGEEERRISPTKTAHEGHAGGLKPRSSRPLAGPLDDAALPPVNATGLNALPWRSPRRHHRRPAVQGDVPEVPARAGRQAGRR